MFRNRIRGLLPRGQQQQVASLMDVPPAGFMIIPVWNLAGQMAVYQRQLYEMAFAQAQAAADAAFFADWLSE